MYKSKSVFCRYPGWFCTVLAWLQGLCFPFHWAIRPRLWSQCLALGRGGQGAATGDHQKLRILRFVGGLMGLFVLSLKPFQIRQFCSAACVAWVVWGWFGPACWLVRWFAGCLDGWFVFWLEIHMLCV